MKTFVDLFLENTEDSQIAIWSKDEMVTLGEMKKKTHLYSQGMKTKGTCKMSKCR